MANVRKRRFVVGFVGLLSLLLMFDADEDGAVVVGRRELDMVALERMCQRQ